MQALGSTNNQLLKLDSCPLLKHGPFCWQAEYEKERFKLPAELVLAAKREQGAPEPAKKKRRMGGSAATNEPSKEEDDKEKLVLWRANREEFNKRLRCMCSIRKTGHKSCTVSTYDFV